MASRQATFSLLKDSRETWHLRFYGPGDAFEHHEAEEFERDDVYSLFRRFCDEHEFPFEGVA